MIPHPVYVLKNYINRMRCYPVYILFANVNQMTPHSIYINFQKVNRMMCHLVKFICRCKPNDISSGLHFFLGESDVRRVKSIVDSATVKERESPER